MPERLQQLESWLSDACEMTGFTIEPASGDASFRRYFRVTRADGSTQIVMDAPPDKEDSAPFLRVAGMLADIGLHAPRVYQQDLEAGFLLLEDLGDQVYLDRLNDQSVGRLYGDALSALAVLQACGPTKDLPEYDRKLLMAEMQLFSDWLLGEHLSIHLSEIEQAQLETSFRLLAEAALEQPRVFVHRDYHSRNLTVTPVHSPGILDFQDAVHGPVTYDLVSLLRDCYIQWPASQIDHWVMGYFELCVQSGVLGPESEHNFLRWFDLMGVQRHLKASGIFARLNHRDGKSGYLADIPRTLGYIVQVAERRSEMKFLSDLIARRVLPAL